MGKLGISVTPAIRVLRTAQVPFVPHPYDYAPHGGTRHSAALLGVDEHAVIKTLVMQDDQSRPLIVLMHGDRQVSTKSLARILDTKSVTPCQPEVAQRHTGYQLGGTSPFGTRKTMPVYVEMSICALPRIYINGGRRGLLVELDPVDLVRVLQPHVVEVATDGH